MSQVLSNYEGLVIAHWFNSCARALTAAASQDGASLDAFSSLTQASSDLATMAANLATAILQQTFANADAAFAEISDAASQAAKTAQALANSIKEVDKELAIGKTMLLFGTAVLSGNYFAALKQLVTLVGQPQKGQGAQDPGAS